MTPTVLLRSVRKLASKPAITTRFEKDIAASGVKQPNVWYKSQRAHWIGWLSEYGGPGFYGRKTARKSAEFAYNHANCSPMVLWLGEASGVSKKDIERARRAAMKARLHMGSQCAAIRKIIPWSTIEARLLKKKVK